MRLLSISLALAAVAAPIQPAGAAPRAFYGATYDGDLRVAAAGVQAKAWRQMRRNGVRASRTVFSWAAAQPAAGSDYDFSASDALVEHAARARIDLLPILLSTPAWAREEPGNWWPRRGRDLGAYAAALVRRYGPDGSFWDAEPEIPRRPVRRWQVYNEPGLTKRYGPVLRAAYRAIKEADPGATVVLAGITGVPHANPWDILDYQYRTGKIKGYFDVAALHLYTGKPRNVLEGVKRFRAVMRRRGNGRKQLWLTEFGITASRGRTEAPSSQSTLRTTDRGMARFLRKTYRLLAAKRRRRAVRLGRAYWYTWASSYERGSGIFRFAGLNQFADDRLDGKPALDAFRRVARR